MKYDEAPSWPLVYRCCTDLEISDGEFSLRPIKWDDRLRTMKWRNGQAKILRNQNRLSESSQNRYFKDLVSTQMLEEQPDQILLGQEKKNTLVAYGGLVNISWKDKRAEMSFLADTELVNTEEYPAMLGSFIKMLGKLAFCRLRIEKIFTETYSFRSEHIEVLEKSGYVKEGVLRRHTIIDGDPIDSIMHGLFLETAQHC